MLTDVLMEPPFLKFASDAGSGFLKSTRFLTVCCRPGQLIQVEVFDIVHNLKGSIFSDYRRRFNANDCKPRPRRYPVDSQSFLALEFKSETLNQAITLHEESNSRNGHRMTKITMIERHNVTKMIKQITMLF